MIISAYSGDKKTILSPLYGRFKTLIKRMVSVITFLVFLLQSAFAQDPVRILVLGDSLSSGYGLPAGNSFPELLQQALTNDGLSVTIENAGVAGDTTTGGAARLDWALASKPDAVIIELGANDALRAIDPAITRQNLDMILAELDRLTLPALLTGMKAPPNLGMTYGREFEIIYPDLAEKYQVVFYPFFLEGVAAQPHFNQPDGIHPNRRGVEVVVERILPYVKKLIEKTGHNP